MVTTGTHFGAFTKGRNWGARPSNPHDGEEYIDNLNNYHCIYDATNSVWWCAAMTTSTSTTTTVSTSTSTSVSTSTTSTSVSTTSTSSSTTTSI